MKIINKNEMEKLITNSGTDCNIVFADYIPDTITSDIMIAHGQFCATQLIPYKGEVFKVDWSLAEYLDDALFAIFDNNDILQMIQTLTKGLKIELKYFE